LHHETEKIEMTDMAEIWLINESLPNFAHCHPRSCGGKEQKPTHGGVLTRK